MLFENPIIKRRMIILLLSLCVIAIVIIIIYKWPRPLLKSSDIDTVTINEVIVGDKDITDSVDCEALISLISQSKASKIVLYERKVHHVDSDYLAIEYTIENGNVYRISMTPDWQRFQFIQGDYRESQIINGSDFYQKVKELIP